MRWAAICLAAFVILFGMYRTIAGVAYTKGSSVSASDFECSKIMTAIMMDNPIERLPLTHIHIDQVGSGAIIATAHFMFLPYSKFEIAPNCREVRRI